MNSSPAQAQSAQSLLRLVARRWMLGVLLGITLSAGLAYMRPLHSLPELAEASIIAIVGCLTAMVVAPWGIMKKFGSDRREVARLTEKLVLISSGPRSIPLSELIIHRDDELGALSRAIHDALAEAMASKFEKRLLTRRMEHEVRRETDRMTAHLQREVLTDPLTGLGNRRALDHRLEELSSAPDGRGAHTAVLAIDIDLFKDVNDALGHALGDQCLVFLADLLKSSLRHEDGAIRLGGDEFIVLMPGQSIDQARAVAERVQSLFSQIPWPHAAVSRPGLSIGIASGQFVDAPSATAAIAAADAALYESKRSGRSRITVKPDSRRAA